MEGPATTSLAYPAAPGIARGVAEIVANLIAVVARLFLKNPRLILLTVPLANRLNRAVRQFHRLAARLAAGKRPRRPPQSSPRRPREQRGQAEVGEARAHPVPLRPRLPTTHGWLIRAGGWEVAAFGSQLEYLLAQPDVAQLLAEIPAAARLLRPIRWMLGYAPRHSLMRKRATPTPRKRPRKAGRKHAAARRRQAAAPFPRLPSLPNLPWLLPKKRHRKTRP